MEDRYLITVIGTQTIDGENEKVEVITSGDYRQENGKTTVSYPQFSEEDPNIRTETTVTLEGDMMFIDSKGERNSRLILEKGRRHQCVYETPLGAMMLGIFTDKLSAKLDEHGGEISASYQLDFNSAAVSSNQIHITVKEKPAQH